MARRACIMESGLSVVACSNIDELGVLPLMTEAVPEAAFDGALDFVASCADFWPSLPFRLPRFGNLDSVNGTYWSCRLEEQCVEAHFLDVGCRQVGLSFSGW